MQWSIVAGVAMALGSAVAVAAVAVAAPASGASPSAHEIANALIHAGVAQKVDTLDGAHLHLHHVVNCLVGAQGAQFSAKAEALSAYHCQGLGNGAIDDAGRDPAVRGALESALDDAERGIAATNLADAHADAGKAIAALKHAQGAER